MVDYINLDYKPSDNDLIALYYVQISSECRNLQHASEEIAKESSIGTWTEISTLSPEIAKKLNLSNTTIYDTRKRIRRVQYMDSKGVQVTMDFKKEKLKRPSKFERFFEKIPEDYEFIDLTE